MSNSYFNFTTGRMVAGENALAEDVNSGFDAVAAGFDKLPTPDATKFLAGAHETTSGSSGNFVLAVTADSYFDGMAVSFKANHSNSGACTLNVGSLGAKSLVDGNGAVLAVGDIVANSIYAARYNSTSDKFHLVGMSSGNAVDAAVVAANIADVATIADNIDELLLVDDNATAAAGSASDASGYADDALTQAGLASGYADAASASAANLPNATTAGADKLLTTNAAGDGWEYPLITAAGKALLDDADAAAQRATLGLGNVANVDTTNASNISSGILDDARIPSTVARLTDYSRKNLLINGGFDVWQRGTSYFSIAGYTADRWIFDIHHGTGGYILRDSFARGQTAVPCGPLYYVNFMVNKTSGVSLSQRVPNFVQFMGKKLTCTFWAKLSTGLVDAYLDVQLNANYGTGGTPSSPTAPIASGTTGSFVPTTTWAKYTSTFDVPVVAPTWGTDVGSDYLELQFTLLNMTGNPGLVHIANVQLEFGDAATDFEYRHPAEEEALCKQFYRTGVLRGPFSQYATNYAAGPLVSFNMRRVPDIILGALTTIGHDGTPGTLYNDRAALEGFSPVYNWTGGTTGRAFFGQATWTADAEL